jgi:hypothetical protein
MFFCPNCDNLFNITNVVPDQKGGDRVNYGSVITSILAKEQIDKVLAEKLSVVELVKQEEYNSLKSTQKEYVYNKVTELTKMNENKLKNVEIKDVPDKVYLKCSNCATTKKVKENTLIFSRVSDNVSQGHVASDLSNMKHSDILPITRRYICPKQSCESHDNTEKREAKFFRLNNSMRLKYTCLACDTTFDHS